MLLLRQEVLDKESTNMQLRHTINDITDAHQTEKQQLAAESRRRLQQESAEKHQLAAEKEQLAAENKQLQQANTEKDSAIQYLREHAENSSKK